MIRYPISQMEYEKAMQFSQIQADVMNIEKPTNEAGAVSKV